MGADALERRLSRNAGHAPAEGLVPLWNGHGLVSATPYAAWAEVHGDLADLDARAAALPEGERKTFFGDMIRSLRMAARLLAGEAFTYEEMLRDLVAAPVGPVDPDVIGETRERLEARLAHLRVAGGTAAERVRRWEESRFLDPSDLAPVTDDLMRAARARTAARIFDCGDYAMSLKLVSGTTFTARCRFATAEMELNSDIGFTRAALKHLVCHEMFPGHATQMLSTRAAVEAGRSGAESLLVAANGATGCVQEGIGDQAVELIEWVEDEDDEVHALLRRLRSAAQTTAAWRLMVEHESEATVSAYLRDAAFGQDAWIAGRLRMAMQPFHGPFIASYFAGNEVVRAVRERATSATREALLATLFEEAHSPASLLAAMDRIESGAEERETA